MAEEARTQRGHLRATITKAATAVRLGSYRRARTQTVTLDNIDVWGAQLTDFDLIIGDNSENYLATLEAMAEKINKDDTEQEQRERELAKSEELERQQSQPPPKRSSIKLNLTLPKFNGSPAHYRRFEELFETLIQQSPSYSDAEKYLQFLTLIGPLADEYAPNLPPTLQSLETVKKRMRDFYNEASKVRDTIRDNYAVLPIMNRSTQTDILRKLIIAWEDGFLALQKSGTKKEQIDNTYVKLMTSHLPGEVLKAINFEREWTVEQLLKGLTDFLEQQLLLNEFSSKTNINAAPRSKPTNARTSLNVSNNRPTFQRSSLTPNFAPRFASSRSFIEKCVFCKDEHKSIYCTKYDSMRCRSIAEELNLCIRCLRPGHHHLDCRSLYKCPCGESHSKVLCNKYGNHLQQSGSTPISTINNGEPLSLPPNPNNTIPKTTSSVSQSIPSQNYGVLIDGNAEDAPAKKYSRPDWLVSFYQTVVVSINGEPVRVLLDSGGGRSMILESCADRLRLPTHSPHSLSIGGLGGSNTMMSNRLVNANLKSIVSDNSFPAILAVVPSLGNINIAAIPSGLYQQLHQDGIIISDTPDYNGKPIEILLGLEYIGQLWLNIERMITDSLCIRESIFGWTVFGVTLKSDFSSTQITITCGNFASVPAEHTTTSELTSLEKQYLDDFVDNKVQLKGHQFYAKLPWLTPINLGTNQKQAHDRFQRLLKSLRLKDRFELYDASLKETISKFAEKAPAIPTSANVYYLPHHLVIRLDKTTTQHRVVFDGSASEAGYSSLNQCLFKGVNSCNSLDLLITFRFGQFAFIADIEKAFLQIKVDEQDRDALRFWWLDEDGKPTVYRFTSVPFGTSASSFLLYAVMHKLLKGVIDGNKDTNMVDTATLIKGRFYVDDLVVSLRLATPQQIQAIKENTQLIFSIGNMNVRKWRTNCIELDQSWSPGASPIVHLLGHDVHLVNDTISLSVDLPTHFQHSVLTKRLFSSLLSRIYDPMGFVSPYVVHLRLVLRKFWSQNLDWDEPAPAVLHKDALSAVKDAHLVNNVTLPRNVLSTNGSSSSLYVFCDASKQAIGAVAYVIVNNVPTLLHSVSKLAKVSDEKKVKIDKEETIAEAELNALVMGAELANYLCKLPAVSLSPHNLQPKVASPFSDVVICSDSLLNLQRLIKHPNDQRSSISLRVNKMKSLVPAASYRHVPTKENPADLISRGCTMTDLLNDKKWFHPPLPSEFTRFDDNITTSIATFVAIDSTCKCSRFNNFGQALRAWRFMARGLQRTLPPDRKQLPAIVLGKILFIKYLQRQHFTSEIIAIFEQKTVDQNSVLKCYKCFLDNDGILRLRTRLRSGANLSEDQVKPIILPEKCHLTELIINFEHERSGHAGKERTAFAVRDQFFVFGLRRYISRLINSCMICRRLRGKPLSADFGTVPSFRYDLRCAPFTNVGVDIFGPLKVAMTTKGKRYGVIFSCATTRAIHLELIHNQTAEEVHRAMNNFISRRGIPHLIYTDNGTNLMSVKKQFTRLLDQLSEQFPTHDYRVKWIQLTASSPWRGGFYERLIKTIKDTLSALTFGKVIDNETLTSALYMVEGRLNSRPLFIREGKVVTPSHFFANRPLTQLPPIGTKTYRELDKSPIVKQYKAFQSHINGVWNAWYSQYLLQLKSFHANLFLPNQSDNLRVGDAVILKNPTPPDQWPFGVVTEVIKSEDGTIRTVIVRTTDRGNIVTKARDIRTLIPFECTQELHADQDSVESVEPLSPDNPISPDTALTGSPSE